MRGHIRERVKGSSYQLKIDIGRDAQGERMVEYHPVYGTRRDAEVRLRELLSALDKKAHVARTVLTVGEHVRERIGQWQKLGVASPKTAERYFELLRNSIGPHLRAIALQDLSAGIRPYSPRGARTARGAYLP